MVTRKSQRFGDARPADAPPGESGRSLSPPPAHTAPPGPGRRRWDPACGALYQLPSRSIPFKTLGASGPSSSRSKTGRSQAELGRASRAWPHLGVYRKTPEAGLLG